MRNCRVRNPGAPPEENGIGIGVEADTTVSGWSRMRKPAASVSGGPVSARRCRYRQCGGTCGTGITVSEGAGTAVITGNQIFRLARGAILGMQWRKLVTGDLALAGADRYPQLRIRDNQVD